MTAFTDLHCHILPGLDDGAKDWAATWDMVEMAVGSHVGGIVCTPHCRLSDPWLLERTQRIGELAEVLNRALAKRQVPLRVFPGQVLGLPDIILQVEKHQGIVFELDFDQIARAERRILQNRLADPNTPPENVKIPVKCVSHQPSQE